MPENKDSYKQILKATSIFGGVQVIKIIVAIAQQKVIAVLLGTAGMGIVGLFTSSIGLVGSLTNFGLGISAVKNVAAADASGDKKKVNVIITVLRRIIWGTGILGVILTFFFSPGLSLITFGNQNYTSAFRWLAIVLLVNQLSSGQLVILQGLRRLKNLARANVLGTVLGLFISIPIYFIWGIDAIVPSIIVASLSALFASWYFSKDEYFIRENVSVSTTVYEGKEMMKMGLLISFSSLTGVAAAYLIRIYIQNHGGIEQVGLFVAGFTIINGYAGMIFSAMAADYYPRLSAVANNKTDLNRTVNQQIEIAILIVGPIVCCFLVFIDQLIILLFSSKFLDIKGMISWAIMGLFFKTSSWAIAYIFLAKGTSKLYFWNELLANIYLLILNMLGYYYWGLYGLGISFLVAYFIYMIQVIAFTNYCFDFKLKKGFYKTFLIQSSIVLICFITIINFDGILAYLIGGFFVLLSFYWSYRKMDNIVGLNSLIIKFKDKLNGK